MNIDDVLSAVRRSQRAWCEQVATGESLDFGVAYTSTGHPDRADANQLRDAWLADADSSEVFQKVERYYQDRGLTCGAWTPASGQPVEPIDELLPARGWLRKHSLAMGLLSRDAERDTAVIESTRILPARAMRRAYRATLESSCGESPSAVDLGIDRLNDSHYDAFIAQHEGEAAGRIGYLEVGDIAALVDFFVLPSHRDLGVETALIAHFLQTVRRLLPRFVISWVDSEERAKRSVLESHGFAVAGELPWYLRNND